MTFLELKRTRKCKRCAKPFTAGSVTGTRFCSAECKMANHRETQRKGNRKYRAKNRATPFVGKGQDCPAAERRPIPADVMALGRRKTVDLTRDDLVEEVRLLTENTPGETWWDEYLGELLEEAQYSEQITELRAAVEMLGGNTEAE